MRPDYFCRAAAQGEHLSIPDLQPRQSNKWVELIKLLIILTAIMAIRNSFGLFLTSIESQFGLTRGETSAFFSIFSILAAFFTVLGGWALDRFGPKKVFIVMGLITILSLVLTGRTTSAWQLYFTYSLLLAAGTGGGFSLALATISRLFAKGRGLALGIGLSGEGVGTLAVAPLATFLITSFNWRIAYSIIGPLAGAIIIGFALFLRQIPGNSIVSVDKTKSSAGPQAPGFSVREAMKTVSFWLLGVVYLTISFNNYLALTHIVPNAIDLGITPARAAIIVALMGGFTIPGRLVIGWASDRTSRKMLAIYCTLVQVAAMVWLAWSHSPWMFYVFAVVFGFTFGGLSNLMATLIGDTFGMANIGAMTGVLVVGFTMGAALGPALGGFIYDAAGSYFLAFVTGAGIACLGVLCMALTRPELQAKLAKASRIVLE
jgi:MFS family permease